MPIEMAKRKREAVPEKVRDEKYEARCASGCLSSIRFSVCQRVQEPIRLVRGQYK